MLSHGVNVGWSCWAGLVLQSWAGLVLLELCWSCWAGLILQSWAGRVGLV